MFLIQRNFYLTRTRCINNQFIISNDFLQKFIDSRTLKYVYCLFWKIVYPKLNAMRLSAAVNMKLTDRTMSGESIFLGVLNIKTWSTSKTSVFFPCLIYFSIRKSKCVWLLCLEEAEGQLEPRMFYHWQGWQGFWF